MYKTNIVKHGTLSFHQHAIQTIQTIYKFSLKKKKALIMGSLNYVSQLFSRGFIRGN